MATADVKCATDGCAGGMAVDGRNRRDANYRAQKMMDRGWTCRDCDNRHAAIKAKEDGLPDLTGSEKQVAWANSLRQRALSTLDALRVRVLSETLEIKHGNFSYHSEISVRALATLKIKLGDERYDRAMAAYRAETNAKIWIDTREQGFAETFEGIDQRLAQEDYLMSPEGKAEVAAEHDAMSEATMRPPEPVSETVAEISVRGSRIVASYGERSETFNSLVKRLGYRWDPSTGWVRTFHAPTMGLLADRVAETAHELLAVGIVVAVHDPEVRAKAIDRSYDQEHTRWVRVMTSGPDKGNFLLTWGRHEDFFKGFRGLRGAAYRDKRCLVLATSRDDVLDFAEVHGFRLTAAAHARAAEVLEQRERGTVVAAVARPVPEPVEELREGPPVALPVPESVEVDSDLVDYD